MHALITAGISRSFLLGVLLYVGYSCLRTGCRVLHILLQWPSTFVYYCFLNLASHQSLFVCAYSFRVTVWWFTFFYAVLKLLQPWQCLFFRHSFCVTQWLHFVGSVCKTLQQWFHFKQTVFGFSSCFALSLKPIFCRWQYALPLFVTTFKLAPACNMGIAEWGMTLKQSSAVHIQALVTAGSTRPAAEINNPRMSI